MKKIIKITLTILLLGLIVSFNSFPNQKVFKNNIENEQLDTIHFRLQDKFQEIVDKYVRSKIFNIKNEKVPIESILENKKQAKDFAEGVFKFKYPKYKNPEELVYEIGEDNSKKLWFVLISYPFPTFGGEIYLIIVKNNCKVIYYRQTK